MNARETLRLPPHFRRSLSSFTAQRFVRKIMRAGHLSTVCEEARCPNISECFAQNTATFMILGDRCTRRCHFCAVTTKKPLPVDAYEPRSVAQAASAMGLEYVVVTSVDRDDLPDRGAAHFALVVRAIKERLPQALVELLVPDFGGRPELVDTVLSSPLDVFGHNVESVPRLYKSLRPQSDFAITCAVLAYAAKKTKAVIKTGMMVGVGEEDHEVLATLDLIHSLGVSIVTIGQYLRPSLKHWPVARYVSDSSFKEFVTYGKKIGLRHVFAGPLVRSSYHAKEAHQALSL